MEETSFPKVGGTADLYQVL